MYRLLILMLCTGFCFGQVLEVDSIYDPGIWSDPDNIMNSDDLYAQPAGNNDPVLLQIDVPADTNGTIDSVKVFLEQYVSDTTRAAWRIRPIVNGSPGTVSSDIMGTSSDQLIAFDISADISGWQDLFDLVIDLRGIKIGGGQNPDWFADYLYVFVYSDVGIFENQFSYDKLELKMPTVVTNTLIFTYCLEIPGEIMIDVYNNAGLQVMTKQVKGLIGTNQIILNKMGNLSKGVYYLHLQTANNHIETGKFIVIE